MSDDEGDVHVCDICQEIFLGTDELEEHMKEDHAAKVVGFWSNIAGNFPI